MRGDGFFLITTSLSEQCRGDLVNAIPDAKRRPVACG
jgi:hypothetical protein